MRNIYQQLAAQAFARVNRRLERVERYSRDIWTQEIYLAYSEAPMEFAALNRGGDKAYFYQDTGSATNGRTRHYATMEADRLVEDVVNRLENGDAVPNAYHSALLALGRRSPAP